MTPLRGRALSQNVASYSRQIHEFTGYLAAWPPEERIDVGMVGRLEDSIMVPEGNLGALGVPFSILESDRPASIDVRTPGVVITTKAAGQALSEAPSIPVDQAGILITFDKGNSVFSANGCIEKKIENVSSVAAEILELQRKGLWRRELVLVSHVIRAKKMASFVAGESGARIEIAAGKDWTPSDPFQAILLHGNITARRGMAIDARAQDVTPLFRASRVRSLLREGRGDEGVVAVVGSETGESDKGYAVNGDIDQGAEIYEVVPGVGIPDE